MTPRFLIRTIASLALLALLGGRPVPATEAPRVVTSIVPVHGLVADVMAGVATPRLLIDGAASPHAYSLKPSDARRLSAARVIFRIGPEFENFLNKPLAALARKARVVDLARAPGVVARRGGKDGHDDHGHDADDPHIWLDPKNAVAMAAAVAAALANIDPPNAARYHNNLKALSGALDTLDRDLSARLRPVTGHAFMTFHAAYTHLAARYGLANAGAVAVTPDRPPGAAHIRRLRHRIGVENVRCLFSEPQFPPRLAATIVEGTAVRVAVLDPLGADLRPGPGTYQKLMRNLGAALVGCLDG